MRPAQTVWREDVTVAAVSTPPRAVGGVVSRVGRALGARRSHLGLAVHLGLWLLALPLRLRRQSFPVLLGHLTSTGGGLSWSDPQEMDRVVRLVVRVCHLWCFRGPRYPRACLRQALALYYTLSRLGYPVTIHFGVHKAKEVLYGHSWVTVQGQPVAEAIPPGVLHVAYSYPPTVVGSARARCNVVQGA